MSSSLSSNSSLLRRPRPPIQHPSNLPPIISQRSMESDLTNHSRASPTIRPMPSLASHQDGLQSPVPTMQSEYDPVFHSQLSKIQKGHSQNAGSDNTTTGGDTGDGSLSRKGLVLPYKPRGPDPFPMREPKRPADVRREFILPIDSQKALPEFTLENFLQKTKYYSSQQNTLKKVILSKANYKKLTLLLEKELTQGNQDAVKTVDVSQQAEIKDYQRRIPRRQLMIEMKSIVNDRLKELGLTSPGKFDGRANDVEQILDEIKEIGDAEGVGRKSQMSLFNKATANVFQESFNRPGSVFDGENTESIITPSELSILNCLMDGGYVLSLKAHFIPQIPELSPLSATLVYLNLSFNEFSEFPREVLFCRELQVLKLRNNPLKDLPHDISKLQKLRTLILSFCCLTALPVSLFSLLRLEFLDISFNKLTFLPNEIKKLERLRFLNVEGNELPGLPCGLLRLNLFRIRVRNNFMSPLFWKENAKNDPQRLTDLCLLQVKVHVVKQDGDKMQRLPPDVMRSIHSFKPCDCCNGPRYGPGLKIVRPCSEIWGIKRIPFIFKSCSPSCYSRFVHNTDPKLTEIIYGASEEKPATPIKEDDSVGRPPSPRDGAITA
ncbi:uncharacterized protein LOC120332587 [Styela clava]